MYEQPSTQNQWRWLGASAVLFVSVISIVFLTAGFFGILG